MIEDEQPPALVVTADFRAGLIYGTTGIPVTGLVTEKWAGPGEYIKNARIQKKVPLVGINTDGSFFIGIIVMYQKTEVATILFDGVDYPEVFTAFSALETFEGQRGRLLSGGSGSRTLIRGRSG